MNRAVFLDRDGILNRVIRREGGIIGSPRKLEEFAVIPEAKALVERLKEWGCLVVVITNQPDIGRAKMSREELAAMHRVLLAEFPVDAIEVCESGDDADRRRKPNPGMILDAAARLDIDLKNSFFLGDAEKDLVAGARAGVRTILLRTDYNRAAHGNASFDCSSFHEIVELLERLIAPPIKK